MNSLREKPVSTAVKQLVTVVAAGGAAFALLLGGAGAQISDAFDDSAASAARWTEFRDPSQLSFSNGQMHLINRVGHGGVVHDGVWAVMNEVTITIRARSTATLENQARGGVLEFGLARRHGRPGDELRAQNGPAPKDGVHFMISFRERHGWWASSVENGQTTRTFGPFGTNQTAWDTWHTVVIRIRGDTMEVSCDGEMMGTAPFSMRMEEERRIWLGVGYAQIDLDSIEVTPDGGEASLASGEWMLPVTVEGGYDKWKPFLDGGGHFTAKLYALDRRFLLAEEEIGLTKTGSLVARLSLDVQKAPVDCTPLRLVLAVEPSAPGLIRFPDGKVGAVSPALLPLTGAPQDWYALSPSISPIAVQAGTKGTLDLCDHLCAVRQALGKLVSMATVTARTVVPSFNLYGIPLGQVITGDPLPVVIPHETVYSRRVNQMSIVVSRPDGTVLFVIGDSAAKAAIDAGDYTKDPTDPNYGWF